MHGACKPCRCRRRRWGTSTTTPGARASATRPRTLPRETGSGSAPGPRTSAPRRTAWRCVHCCCCIVSAWRHQHVTMFQANCMPWRLDQGVVLAPGLRQRLHVCLCQCLLAGLPNLTCSAIHGLSATAGAHQRGRHCESGGVPRAAGEPAAAGLCRRVRRRCCAALAIARLVVICASVLRCCHHIGVEVLPQLPFYMIVVRAAAGGFSGQPGGLLCNTLQSECRTAQVESDITVCRKILIRCHWGFLQSTFYMHPDQLTPDNKITRHCAAERSVLQPQSDKLRAATVGRSSP